MLFGQQLKAIPSSRCLLIAYAESEFGVSTPFYAAVQFGSIALHPTPDRDVIDGEVSLGHEFFQIPEAESKPKIPADTWDNDLGFKMSPFEQCRPVSLHEPQAYQIASTDFATLPGVQPFGNRP